MQLWYLIFPLDSLNSEPVFPLSHKQQSFVAEYTLQRLVSVLNQFDGGQIFEIHLVKVGNSLRGVVDN